HIWLSLFAEAVVGTAPDNSNNFGYIRSRSKRLSQSVLARPQCPRERFVDDHHLACRIVVSSFERSALKNRYVQGFEISVCNYGLLNPYRVAAFCLNKGHRPIHSQRKHVR